MDMACIINKHTYNQCHPRLAMHISSLGGKDPGYIYTETVEPFAYLLIVEWPQGCTHGTCVGTDTPCFAIDLPQR